MRKRVKKKEKNVRDEKEHFYIKSCCGAGKKKGRGGKVKAWVDKSSLSQL